MLEKGATGISIIIDYTNGVKSLDHTYALHWLIVMRNFEFLTDEMVALFCTLDITMLQQ